MSGADERAEDALRVPAEDYFALLLETLGNDPERRAAFTPGGRSMCPTLRDRKDVVYLGLPVDLRVGDIALYRDDGGRYALHRLIARLPDGRCVFCGDGHVKPEDPIPVDRVFAIVYAIDRGGLHIDCRRSIPYRLYSRFWTATRPIRRAACLVKRALVPRKKRAKP